MKHTFKKFLLTSLSLTALYVPGAYAQYPVYDAASYAQMASQIDAMARDYQKQIDQLEEAYAQTNAIIGKRNMGDLLNSEFEKSLRSSLPPIWQNTLSALETSENAEVRALYNQYMQKFDPLSASDIYAGTNSSLRAAAQNRLQTNASSSIASEMAFNRTGEQIKIYEELLSRLNESEDLKTSVDLQSRISIENGLILSELMRLKAIQIQQKAAQENTNISAIKRSAASNKYDAREAAKAMQLTHTPINLK